jgi:hypothetical protein
MRWVAEENKKRLLISSHQCWYCVILPRARLKIKQAILTYLFIGKQFPRRLDTLRYPDGQRVLAAFIL